MTLLVSCAETGEIIAKGSLRSIAGMFGQSAAWMAKRLTETRNYFEMYGYAIEEV